VNNERNDDYDLMAILRKDILRYLGTEKYSPWRLIKSLYLQECLLYVVMFRLCQRIIRIENKIISFLLKYLFMFTVFRFTSLFLGIEVHVKANIGEGMYIGHFGDIHIGPVTIGKYCNISQGVTIGLGRIETDRYGLPIIGDNVYIGPGAKIFGRIRIGNNVSIGANAVVSKDIPDNAIVVGNPGRIIGYQDKNPNIHNIA